MNKRTQKSAVSALMSACLIGLGLLVTACKPTGTWGLLASPGHENEPPKGVYFFPGDPKLSPENPPPHGPNFTSISDNVGRDYHWNDQTSDGLTARKQIVAEIAALGTNVIFDQYSGVYTDIHFVVNNEAAFLAVFSTSKLINGPLVIPALEDSFQCGGPCPIGAQPVFKVTRDIAPATQVAKDWITHLVQSIKDNGLQDKWAQIYNRSGEPRYAIQISQATSDNLNPLKDFFAAGHYLGALEEIARYVLSKTQMPIGFILTPVEDDNPRHYSLSPYRSSSLTVCDACLAILPYFSELPRVHEECEAKVPYPQTFRGFVDCNALPNNAIGNLARLKKDRTNLWVNSGVPYYLDLDSGYDAHRVFNDRPASGPSIRTVWGETAYLYDPWRNAQSELKGHQGGNRAPSGVVYNTWNGYTEASIALDSTHQAWDPSFPVPVGLAEHEPLGYPYPWNRSNGQIWLATKDFYDLRRRWLTDVFSVDPRLCDHYYYENGQRKFHVIGAICEKFTEKYGEYGPLGAPASDAHPLGNRTVEDFQNGQIYWNKDGAREVHGGIYAAFRTLLQNGRNLGAPITDESTTPDGVGRFNHFEFGSIYWTPTTLGVGIWGPFRDRWAALGWERGRLGYPTLEPTQSDVRNGWFARFQGGNMYAVSSSAPAFEVWGGILAEYGRLGWERSWLGYPVTGELPSGRWCTDGRFNQFQNGFIDWCPGKNACSHHGDGHCDDGRAQPNL